MTQLLILNLYPKQGESVSIQNEFLPKYDLEKVKFTPLSNWYELQYVRRFLIKYLMIKKKKYRLFLKIKWTCIYILPATTRCIDGIKVTQLTKSIFSQCPNIASCIYPTFKFIVSSFLLRSRNDVMVSTPGLYAANYVERSSFEAIMGYNIPG